MKIGLLTFHDTCNFGSMLQTYGLFRAITDMGYDCEVIDYQCQNIAEREIPKPLHTTISPKVLLKYVLIGRHRSIKYRYLSRFLNDKMKLSKRCVRESISAVCDEYDKVFVGSDIVWGLDITGGDLTYFLDFLRDPMKKYAFASSIGNPWDDREKAIIKPLLGDFHLIAVREEESADWVEDLTGKRPQVVCDPTMLLDADTWRDIAEVRCSKRDYILVYFDNRDHDCINNAIRYAQKKNLKVYYVNDGLSNSNYHTVKPHSISEFLSLIDNAAFVITASYHGMLFSIYFNKEFAYFNRAHRSRMNTLSKKLHIDDRNGEECDIMKMKPIDYVAVNRALSLYRMESFSCLERFLLA